MPFQPKYTEEEKTKACYLYVLEFGSSKKVAAQTGIPASTIRRWSKEEWWSELTAQIRAKHQDRLDARLTGMLTYILDKQFERIQKGDEVVMKNGEIAYKAVSLRDLTDAMDKVIRNRALTRGEPSSIKKTVSVDQRLKEMQDKMSAMAEEKKKLIAEESEENVVH